MSMYDPKLLQAVAHLRRRLDAVEARGELVEGILDLPPETPCQGRPSKCGARCTEQTCPLNNNRIHDIGSMMQDLLHQTIWVRCMADEMESRGEQYDGFSERVRLRVQRAELLDRIQSAENDLHHAGPVKILAEGIKQRICQLKRDLATVEERLAGNVGSRR